MLLGKDSFGARLCQLQLSRVVTLGRLASQQPSKILKLLTPKGIHQLYLVTPKMSCDTLRTLTLHLPHGFWIKRKSSLISRVGVWQNLTSLFSDCGLESGRLRGYYVVSSINCTWSKYHQLILPACLKEAVLGSVHDCIGQMGIWGTQNLLNLRKRCLWVGMHGEVEQWVK